MVENNRVVVTGIGFVVPPRDSPDQFWSRLMKGDSYITAVPDLLSAARLVNKSIPVVGAPMGDIKLSDYMPSDKHTEEFDTTTKLALVSTHMAMQDSDIKLPSDTSVFIGSARGNTRVLEEKLAEVEDALQRGRPLSKLKHIRGASLTSSSSIAAAVSRVYGLEGSSLSIGTACTSSLNAVGVGYNHILSGQSEVSVVGGA